MTTSALTSAFSDYAAGLYFDRVFEYNEYDQFFDLDGVKEVVRVKLIAKLSPVFEARYVYVRPDDEDQADMETYKLAHDGVRCLYGFLLHSESDWSEAARDDFDKVFEECVEMFGDTKPARS
jgi:hypothetical protein